MALTLPTSSSKTPPRSDRGGVSVLGTRRSLLPNFPASESRQLAKQARNRDHHSSDPCSQAKKQKNITQEHRHVTPPFAF